MNGDKMTLSEELQWRGLLQDTTIQDLTVLDDKTWTFYHGFDASSDSQTIGNLAAMMIDKLFMRHGHKAILLAGGSTSLVGDPGGKDSERQIQSEETIAENVEAAKRQLESIFAGQEFTMVNNLDWTRDLSVLDYLRNIGKHYSMTPLVQRDYIASRMGEDGGGISYAEFSYTLLQGLDYLHLYDNYGCTLQFGGSDQWGNCLSGVELIRKARGAEAHVITLPLVINQATGKKFGKSEEGAVWLDPNKTSPYKFYQFWLNADDQGVEHYLKIYTELDKQTIDDLIAEHTDAPHMRKAQKKLAQEVTSLVHGQAQVAAVEQVTELVFGKGDINITDEVAAVLRAELPVFKLDAQTLASNDNAVFVRDILVELGMASSKSEARKLIKAGAVKLGGQAVNDEDYAICSLDNPGIMLIKKGKNSLGVIDVTG